MLEKKKLREQEEFYLALDAKHAAEDDDKDSGRFYMAMIHQLNGFRNFEKLTVFTTNFYLKKQELLQSNEVYKAC